MNENLTKDLPPDGVKLILAQLGSMDSRLTAMETRFREIETRLTSLEERVDRRLGETRPMWEQVLERLGRIETRQDGFDQKLTGFDQKLTGFDQKLTGFDQKLTGFDQKLTGFDQKLTTVDTAINNLGLDMRAGFKRLERQMAQLAADVVGLRTDQSDLERRMDRLEDKFDARPQPDKTPN